MQPLGATRDLEADASWQEEEDEKEEAVWLREQGHCKMRSVQDHPFQGSTIGCSSDRRGTLPGVLGRHGRAIGVFVMAGRKLVWVARQGKGGCRSRQPWGTLYHHSEKARGSHVYKEWVCECEWEINGEPDAGGEERSTRGCWGAAVGIRPQNMVVSYLVLTGRLLGSRSKSQVVLPRECMSASISRGSICRGGGREEGREEGVRRAAVEAIAPHWQVLSSHMCMWIRGAVQWSCYNHRHSGLNPQHGWCLTENTLSLLQAQQKTKAMTPWELRNVLIVRLKAACALHQCLI